MRPPHLNHYGIIFPLPNPTMAARSRFYETLHQEVLRRQGAPYQFSLYYYNFFEPFETVTPSPYHERLLADLAAQRLAGLILASSPEAFAHTPIITQPDIPRVALASLPNSLGIPMIKFDIDDFFRKAFVTMTAHGRRKAAIFSIHLDRHMADQHTLLALAAQHGIEVRDYWRHGFSNDTRPQATAVTQLLMHLPDADRPDTLIIADDNLIDPIIAGLNAARVRVPEELQLIVLSNYPAPPPPSLSVQMLYFDCRAMLATALESLLHQREALAGNAPPVPAITALPAFSLEELTAISAVGVDKLIDRNQDSTYIA